MTVQTQHMRINRKDLENIEIPESTKTFQPVPHHQAYDLALEIASKSGLNFMNDRIEITKGGLRSFMLLMFEWPGVNGYQYCIGLRGCNDKSSSFACSSGPNVEICSNQIIHGSDINIVRKHSKYILNDIGDMFETAITAGKENFLNRVNWLEEFKKEKVTHQQGQMVIGAAAALGIIPRNIAIKAQQHWIQPPFEEFDGENNLYGVHNALTWGMHKHRPQGKMEAHKKINNFFNRIETTEGRLVLQ